MARLKSLLHVHVEYCSLIFTSFSKASTQEKNIIVSYIILAIVMAFIELHCVCLCSIVLMWV